MYRRPEKVIAACERLVPVAIDWALKRPGGIATPVVFMPLHKGADGFMNDEQFTHLLLADVARRYAGPHRGGVHPVPLRRGSLRLPS